MKSGMDKAINENTKQLDTMLIHGLHDAEDKSLRAQLFVGKNHPTFLFPAASCTTVQCAGAGIDVRSKLPWKET